MQLDYRRTRGRVAVDALADGFHITISTCRRSVLNYLGCSLQACFVGEWLTCLLSPVIFPCTFIALALFASSRPRAELSWTKEKFDLQLASDQGGGWHVERFEYPASKVESFRRNRFSRAIYFRVTGVIDTDILGDLDEETFEAFVEAIDHISSSLAASNSERQGK